MKKTGKALLAVLLAACLLAMALPLITGAEEGEDNVTPDTAGNITLLQAYLDDHPFAFYSAATDEADHLASHVRNMLWEAAFCEFYGTDDETGETVSMGSLLRRPFPYLETGLNTAVTLGTRQAADADNDLNLPYYTVTIQMTETATDTVTGTVYVLENSRDIVIRGEKDGEVVYTTMTAPSSDTDTLLAVDYDEVEDVFGNYAFPNALSNNVNGVYASHITQEHPELPNDATAYGVESFGFRLFVVSETYRGFKVDAANTAANWEFISSPYTGTSATADGAAYEIFYANNSFTIQPDGKSPTISAVALDTEQISEDAATITEAGGNYTVTFNTGYDSIPLIITYEDNGETEDRYITVERVGLGIGLGSVFPIDWDDPEGDQAFYSYHGTDHLVYYSPEDLDIDGEFCAMATFYYDSNATISTWAANDNTVADGYDALTKVNLYVTVTLKDGTVTHQVIADAITEKGQAGEAHNNGGNPDYNWLGYANQGNYHYYDDFVLWSGSWDEVENIQSISAIAFVPGDDDDSFGGVKVGSGAGVTWALDADE